MEKIDAAKDVSDHTTFGSSDIPPMGVWTDHQPELEKVRAPREKWGAFFAFEVKQAKSWKYWEDQRIFPTTAFVCKTCNKNSF